MTKSSSSSWAQSPQIVTATFDKLDGERYSIGTWLAAKFADLGWEPYAFDNYGCSPIVSQTHYLKKAFD